MKQVVNKFSSSFLIIIIISVAAFLRLYNIEYCEFKGDEARNSFKALKFIKEGDVPLTSSISSTGINEPPAFMYILSIPFLFSTNPVVATVFIAILNIGGIVLCFLLIKKYFSIQAALISIAFYSVNPWQVLFSRKIWTQNLLAPFVVLFFYLIFKAAREEKKEFIIYASLVLGIILQLHLSAAYFLLVFMLIIVLYYKQINGKYLVLGIAGMMVTFIPYFIFQIKSDFVDFDTLKTISDQNRVWHKSAFTFPLMLLTTNGFEYSFGSDFTEFLNKTINIRFIDQLSTAIIIISIPLMFYKSNRMNIILTFCILIGTFYLFSSKAPILYEHYFNSILPVMFMITGIAVDTIVKNTSAYIKYFVLSLLVILILYQFTFSYSLLSFVKHKECIQGDYGVPFYHRKKFIADHIESYPTEYIEGNFQDIHLKSCFCVKCDPPATHFIIKNLREDYSYWPSPEE